MNNPGSDCGLPDRSEFEHVPTVGIENQIGNTIHYHRFRSKRGLNQPDRRGSFWHLSFAEPLPGPVALRIGSHFGPGLFNPIVRGMGMIDLRTGTCMGRVSTLDTASSPRSNRLL